MTQTWIDELREAAAAETGPLVATLATVCEIPSGAVPEARSVIIRSIADDGVLMFTSDSRSEKAAQMCDEPRVAVVFWLAKSRRQFRISGSARLEPADSPGRTRAWREMSDTARAVFTWPEPGLPFAEDALFLKTIAADAEPPASFDAFTVVPETVDALDLKPHPHRRTRWTRLGSGWEPAAVNP